MFNSTAMPPTHDYLLVLVKEGTHRFLRSQRSGVPRQRHWSYAPFALYHKRFGSHGCFGAILKGENFKDLNNSDIRKDFVIPSKLGT